MSLVRLAVVFTLAELADLASYLQAPHLEANPFVAGRDPSHAAALKVAAIALAWGLAALSPRWRPRSRALLELVLAGGVAWAGFAAGTNVATLSTVAAASRSAQEPAPIPDDGTGFEQGRIPAAPGLSAVPSEAAPHSLWPVLVSPSVAPRDEDVRPRHVRAPAIYAAPPAPRLELRGPASWYCLPGRSACTHGFAAAGAYAAAGPRIRAALGARWRGRVVLVAGVPVRLIDWCACPGGRLLDLYAGVFRRLGPLSAGVLEVAVAVPRGTTGR